MTGERERKVKGDGDVVRNGIEGGRGRMSEGAEKRERKRHKQRRHLSREGKGET